MTVSCCSRLRRGIFMSVFAALLAAALSTDDALAQGAPDSVSFQGFVTDPGGEPLNTTVAMTFKLYKGGSAVWTETQPSVAVTDGLFNVLLGGVAPLDAVEFDQPIELGIAVGADPETVPRTPLGAAPFALGMRGMHAVSRAVPGAVSYNIVGGAPNNAVDADVSGATIGGGGGVRSAEAAPNTVTGNFGTVSGGAGNEAGGHGATVGGGIGNTSGGLGSTVTGGIDNAAVDQASVVGGGQDNAATGGWSVVGGGSSNQATGGMSTIGGGFMNRATANNSTVPGGQGNWAGASNSFAAGLNAQAVHQGTFVWNDGSLDSLTSTGTNQFLIQAFGGVGINRDDPDFPIHIGTNFLNGNGAHLTVLGAWTNGSSQTFKYGFEEIDKTDLLERLSSLSVTKWHYLGEDEFSHIGPTAEDFRQTFGLGHDERYITTVDAEGVALAAIQGLYELVLAQQAEITMQRAELEELKEGLQSSVSSPVDER